MTNQQNHPITPPPELVDQWIAEIRHEGTPVRVAASDLHIATQAARWGADMELEACINYFYKYDTSWGEDSDLIVGFRADRRPKPPSLKEQALEILEYPKDFWSEAEMDTIRRALEQLDE